MVSSRRLISVKIEEESGMLQTIIFPLVWVATGYLLAILTKPLRASYIASGAIGTDPEEKVVILTKAFELDRFNRKIAHSLAKAHLVLGEKDKAERRMHLEKAADALLFAQSDKCHWWLLDKSLKQSAADLRVNTDKKLRLLNKLKGQG